MAGIYIHIPFFTKACHYCDFHFSTSLKNKTELVQSILKEVTIRKDYLGDEPIETIYFGGGTPGLLSVTELSSLLKKINETHYIKKDAEITLEVNPENISSNYVKEIKEIGVNRLSIGVQSFFDEHLKWMNRSHSAKEAFSSIKIVQDGGIENITIDLIYGFSSLSFSQWQDNLDKAMALNLPHFSAYCLTVEPKTVLAKLVSSNASLIPDDETSLSQFDLMVEVAKQNKFIHYEISNFGKEGGFSKHNSSYWKGAKYLGLGPSAHSFDGISRQWNIKNNSLYIKHVSSNEPFFEKEILTLKNRYNEYVLTSLRTIWGTSMQKIKSDFPMFYNHFITQSESLLNRKLIIKDDQLLYLNEKAKFMADNIALELFAD